jgi:hypothetical protein
MHSNTALIDTAAASILSPLEWPLAFTRFNRCGLSILFLDNPKEKLKAMLHAPLAFFKVPALD